MEIITKMAEKSIYSSEVEPQEIDFTLRETVMSIGHKILNVAGRDARSKGFGVDTLGHDNLTWVLSRMALELDYRPGEYAAYEIATWISDFNRIMSTRNFTLTDRDDRIFGRAVTQWCVIDLSTRRPADINQITESHAQWLVDSPSPMQRPGKVAPPEGYLELKKHDIVYSDIDFNRHVNTMRYIELMLDMLPLEVLSEDRNLRLDVNFLHEARYGQRLVTVCGRSDDAWRFEIRTDNDVVCVRACLGFR